MITHKTIITQYGNDVRIKPRGSLWQIVNNGYSRLVINNGYGLSPHESFGIDVTNLLGVNNSIEVENNTEFTINFDPTYAYIPPFPKTFLLIETLFKTDDMKRKKKIIYDTSITPVGIDKRIKPRGALWALVSNAYTPVIVNNSLTLYQNERFGVDVTSALLLADEVENDTEFDIRFSNAVVGFPKKAFLIETNFKTIN